MSHVGLVLHTYQSAMGVLFTLHACSNGLFPKKGAIGRHHTRAEDLFQWGRILFE